VIRRSEIDAALRGSNPAPPNALERLDLERARREHLAGVAEEPRGGIELPALLSGAQPTRPTFPAARPRRLALTFAASAVAMASIMLGFGLGSAGSPAPALGALERLAKVSPHVLLDAPGWRAEAAYRVDGKVGVLSFHRAGGATVEVRWRSAPARARDTPPSSGALALGTRSVLGAPARIYVRVLRGSPEREYFAVWTQAGRQLQLRSTATSAGAFEHTLAALRLAGRDAWLAALPRRLVKRGKWVTPRAFTCRSLGGNGPRVCSS
jgi:hypothetical protein